MNFNISVGDKFEVTDEFADSFVSSVGRKMRGRVAVVIRRFSVMAVFGDGARVELEFIQPTQRHKPYKHSFEARRISMSVDRGELKRVCG